jgi:hypothetical protein
LREFQREVDEADYNWLEYQAYAFAGLVLVPTGHLKTQFQSAADAAERIGFSRLGESEAFLEYVTETLREVRVVCVPPRIFPNTNGVHRFINANLR